MLADHVIHFSCSSRPRVQHLLFQRIEQCRFFVGLCIITAQHSLSSYHHHRLRDMPAPAVVGIYVAASIGVAAASYSFYKVSWGSIYERIQRGSPHPRCSVELCADRRLPFFLLFFLNDIVRVHTSHRSEVRAMEGRNEGPPTGQARDAQQKTPFASFIP